MGVQGRRKDQNADVPGIQIAISVGDLRYRVLVGDDGSMLDYLTTPLGERQQCA